MDVDKITEMHERDRSLGDVWGHIAKVKIAMHARMRVKLGKYWRTWLRGLAVRNS